MSLNFPDKLALNASYENGRSNARKQLEEVKNAIAAIMAEQEYTIGDRTLKQADLGQLRIWRNQLAVQVQGSNLPVNLLLVDECDGFCLRIE